MTIEYERFRDANVRNLCADLQRALEDARVDHELDLELIVGRALSVTAKRGQGGGRRKEGGRGSGRGREKKEEEVQERGRGQQSQQAGPGKNLVMTSRKTLRL